MGCVFTDLLHPFLFSLFLFFSKSWWRPQEWSVSKFSLWYHKTNWWWELSKWSHKIQWVDNSTTSHYYFDRKPIGTANGNLNLDTRARRDRVGKAIFILANSIFTSIGNSTCYWQKIIKQIKTKKQKKRKGSFLWPKEYSS